MKSEGFARLPRRQKSIRQQSQPNKIKAAMTEMIDFDLTMSVLAFNLFRLFALETYRYKNSTSTKLYESILLNSADITVDEKQITVALKKKRMLPQ